MKGTKKEDRSIKLNRIYHLRAEEFLMRVKFNSIDLTVTSPPYDKLRSYNNRFDVETIAYHLLDVTKPGGVCVWVVSDQTVNGSKSGTSFRQALKFLECGWNLHDTMIWRKTNPMPTCNNRYSDEFEYMFVFSKGKPKTFNAVHVKTIQANRKQTWSERPHESKVWKKNGTEVRRTLPTKPLGNVWDIATGKGGSSNDIIAFKHPAIFPEKLAAQHIYTWSNPGDVVCDFFMGAGTTAKMALQLGRNFTGCDCELEFVKLGSERIRPHLLTLFNQEVDSIMTPQI